MEIYEDIPVDEETIRMLDLIIEKFGLENHNAAINFLIGNHFLTKAKEEGDTNEE